MLLFKLYLVVESEGSAVSGSAQSEMGNAHELLLRAVAEELKLPLLQITRHAELHGDDSEFQDIHTSAEMALRLVDGYLLGLELSAMQGSFELEPLSVAAVLYDTAQELTGFAKLYDVSLTLDIGSAQPPVMAHRKGLQAALFSLGSNLIAALAAGNEDRELQLALHRGPGGVIAGAYGSPDRLNQKSLRQARELYGHVRQPLSKLITGSAAGIFVADTLLNAMSARLLSSRHDHSYGLAASLPYSRQLSLV
jgi:hypothetical protein